MFILVGKQTPIQPDPTAKAQLGHKLNSVLWIYPPERIIIRYSPLNYAV